MQKLMTVFEKSPYGTQLLERKNQIARAEGKTEGKAEGKAEDIISVLTRRFEETIPKKLQKQIMSVNDIDKLDELFNFAFDCVSVGEFATAFN